jgi:hypothetical protein
VRGWATVAGLIAVVAWGAVARAQEEEPESTEPSASEVPAPSAEATSEGSGSHVVPLEDAPLNAYADLYWRLARGDRGGQRGALGLPGLDAVIGGVAELLVSRAEAEAEAYGIETLHEQLCAVDAVGALVPTTCELLGAMVDARGGPSGRARLDALVAALRSDLRTLPSGIVRAILVSVQGDPLEGPRLWLATVAELLDGARAGVSPDELVDRLFAVALACDVRAEGAGGRRACTSDEGREAQRGLLYAALVARGALSGALDADNVVAFFRLDADTAGAAELARATLRLVRTVRQLQRAIRDASDPELSSEARRASGLAIARGLAGLVLDADAVVGTLTSREGATHRRRDAAREVLHRLLDASSLGPNEALAQSLALLRVVVDLASESDAVRARATEVLRLSARWMSAVSTAVSLAAAEDADAIHAILEQLVAPVGSWRGKRDGRMISLTGLVGISAFRDRLLAAEPVDTWGFGLHASLGLDLNLVGGSAGTFGLYVGLLDFGSIASVPFGLDVEREVLVEGTEVEERVETKVRLLSVLSPGVFARVGLGRTPFVLGAGASFVPEARTLRRERDGEDELRALDAVRFQVFLAIDTTLWVL